MKSKINALICLYEIIGGILGVCITLYYIFFSINLAFKADIPLTNRLLSLFIFIIIIALYILSFIGGFCLWKKKKKGIILSKIVQVFQIPYIITSSFTYAFISGLQLGPTVTVSSKIFKFAGLFYLGSSFNIHFGSGIKYIILGINIIPILVIYYLIKIEKTWEI